jgi:hypothetical protein
MWDGRLPPLHSETRGDHVGRNEHIGSIATAEATSMSTTTDARTRPCVLIAHAFPAARLALVAALVEARPGLEVQGCAPDGLDAALAALPADCAPVVVCSELTTLTQERAHGWVVDLEQQGLLLGMGDEWQAHLEPTDDPVAAVLDRIDAPPLPQPWVRGEAHPVNGVV